MPSGPTYYGQVAEILSENCAGCHTQGGVGPTPLYDATSAAEAAPAIVAAIEDGSMPPWPPGRESPPMKGERRLSSQDKATLVAWASAGAPLGEHGAPQGQRGVQTALQAEPDRLLVMDPPYLPDMQRQDDYRCFLLDPQLDADTYVTGYRVRPDQAALFHHAILFELGPDAVASAEALDRNEEGPGWTCFGGPGLGDSTADFGFLGFWVPGTDGTDFPEGTGKLLEAGSRVIMQVHYHLDYAFGVEVDASAVELFLAPVSTVLRPVKEMVLLAPVEVRCPGPHPDDPNDPCNRDYALKHSELKSVAQFSHFPCGTRPDDFLRREIGDGSRQENHCDLRMSKDAVALGVVGHMHLQGRSITIELNPDDEDAQTLLHIPDWDFDWQGQYWYQEPVPVQRGDTLRITCVYDNSGPIEAPDHSTLQPRYMTWGEGTKDEMCIGALNYLEPEG